MSSESTEYTNEFGQPIGFPVPNWTGRPHPPTTSMEGRSCVVEILDPKLHAQDLYQAFAHDSEGRNWTYLGVGPFTNFDIFRRWLDERAAGSNFLAHAIIDKNRSDSSRAVGMISYTNIEPDHGVIEIGGVYFSTLLQRTTVGTEAVYLMMRRVFEELGYRRCVWRSNNLNAKSKAAAIRYGFRFECVKRQERITKGFSRDSALFSMIDSEWPRIKLAFERWLDPKNFDEEGNQRERLSDLTRWE